MCVSVFVIAAAKKLKKPNKRQKETHMLQHNTTDKLKEQEFKLGQISSRYSAGATMSNETLRSSTYIVK